MIKYDLKRLVCVALFAKLGVKLSQELTREIAEEMGIEDIENKLSNMDELSREIDAIINDYQQLYPKDQSVDLTLQYINNR